jgi:hypothetical protein
MLLMLLMMSIQRQSITILTLMRDSLTTLTTKYICRISTKQRLQVGVARCPNANTVDLTFCMTNFTSSVPRWVLVRGPMDYLFKKFHEKDHLETLPQNKAKKAKKAKKMRKNLM